MNVLDMKCLRNLVGESGTRRVRNEEMYRKAGIERKLQAEWVREFCDGLNIWRVR